MNKVALITGACGSIASAVNDCLQTNGYRTGLLDLNIEETESDNHLALKCDITNPGQVETAIKKTIDKFKTIDVLFNSAGLSYSGTIEKMPLEDLMNIYNVNTLGTVIASKAVLPTMKLQKSGHIINMGSLRGKICGHGKAAYSMSKFAVRAFSRTLKEEVEKYGIKVTVINPGFVDTNIYGNTSLRPHTQTIPGQSLKQAPITQPLDIAKTILYVLDLSPGATIEEISIGKLWGLR